MKKLLFIFALTIGYMGAFAQGGSWYVGGLVGFDSKSEDFGKNKSETSWYFSPEVGTFLNDQWSVGLALSLNGSSESNDDGDIMSSSMFAPDLYGRRWWSVGDYLSLFVGLDVAFGSGSTTTYRTGPNNEDETFDKSMFATNVNGGVAFAMAQRWTLLLKFAALGYESTTVDDNSSSRFGLIADGNVTSNQFIFVGLYYTFLN
jgi:hypothetical protein